MRPQNEEAKPLIWRGSSKIDFMAFPRTVQREMGYALFLAQIDERHPTMAKTLKGFGGGNVIEIKESYRVMLVARSTPFAMLTRLCASRIPEKVQERQDNAQT